MPTTENADLTTNVMLRRGDRWPSLHNRHRATAAHRRPPAAHPRLRRGLLRTRRRAHLPDRGHAHDQGRRRALPRPAQRAAHAGQPRRRARALRARLHARGLRAPLGARRGRGGWGRAAAVGAAADPRDQGRRPADRGARVRPRLAGARSSRRWTWRAPTSTLLPSRRCERLLRRIRDARRTISSSAG
jgi:hypothetical protein